MGLASIPLTPPSFSRHFNVCTATPNLRGPELDWPSLIESSDAMAGGFGPRARQTRERPSSLHCMRIRDFIPWRLPAVDKRSVRTGNRPNAGGVELIAPTIGDPRSP